MPSHRLPAPREHVPSSIRPTRLGITVGEKRSSESANVDSPGGLNGESGKRELPVTHESPEEIEQIIDRYHREKGWPGIKTYAPRQNLAHDDPLFEPYFDGANELGLYAGIDPAGIPPDGQVETIARRYPDLEIHLDHCGRSWAYAKWAVSVAAQFENVRLQLNYTAATNGVIEYLVDAVGADRLLWGTDVAMRDPRPQASWLAFTRLTRTQKERIFGENVATTLRAHGVEV